MCSMSAVRGVQARLRFRLMARDFRTQGALNHPLGPQAKLYVMQALSGG